MAIIIPAKTGTNTGILMGKAAYAQEVPSQTPEQTRQKRNQKAALAMGRIVKAEEGFRGILHKIHEAAANYEGTESLESLYAAAEDMRYTASADITDNETAAAIQKQLASSWGAFQTQADDMRQRGQQSFFEEQVRRRSEGTLQDVEKLHNTMLNSPDRQLRQEAAARIQGSMHSLNTTLKALQASKK